MPLEMVWSSPAEGLVETRRKLANAPPSRLEKRIAELADQLEAEEGLRPVGSSRKWHEVLGQAARVAATETTVLLTGESGTGKEVLARLIHRGSRRAKGPFVALNCAALPESLLESELFGHERGAFTGALSSHAGHIEQAAGGTLFLDELGEMSLRMQAMLLRFADTGEMQPVGAVGMVHGCDVRLITATNRDLQVLIETGAFRQDLFYRVNVIAILVPPLRDHPEDIPDLLQHYLQRASITHGMSVPEIDACAIDALIAYGWPGNVRELRNVAERLVLEGFERPVTADDLRFSPTTQNYAELDPAVAESGRTAPLWDQFEAGKNFWAVVYLPFKHRELTRREIIELIHDGLSKTAGSYRNLLALFNLPAADYKRFHAFLRQQHCNLDVRRYRRVADNAAADKRAVSSVSVRHTAADSRR